MDFGTVGSLHQQLKTTRLKVAWTQKQRSGDVTTHKKSVDEWLTSAQTARDEPKKDDKARMERIMAKVSSGKRLTEEEKSYLKAGDPITYEKVRAIEREQKTYEQELKRCRTKEEVRRVKMAHLGAAMTEANAISNNAAIPEEKKAQLLSLEGRRTDALRATERRFVKRGDYERLPDEQEKQTAEHTENEREHALHRGEQTEDKREHALLQSEHAGKHDDAPVSSTEPTPEEAVRRVRRAKARALYAALSVEQEAAPEVQFIQRA